VYVIESDTDKVTTALSARSTAARVATLERNAPRLVGRAQNAGVDISFFARTHGYAGPLTDWVIAPATERDTIVPKAQRRDLQALTDAGLDFPLIYVAHEVQKGQLGLSSSSEGGAEFPAIIDKSAAQRAVGLVPPPFRAAATSQQLGTSAAQVLSALRASLPVLGAIAMAPLVVPALALGALAKLDPIIFGVIPAGHPSTGASAAWYVLAQWEW
jgi:hypothetical protein